MKIVSLVCRKIDNNFNIVTLDVKTRFNRKNDTYRYFFRGNDILRNGVTKELEKKIVRGSYDRSAKRPQVAEKVLKILQQKKENQDV